MSKCKLEELITAIESSKLGKNSNVKQFLKSLDRFQVAATIEALESEVEGSNVHPSVDSNVEVDVVKETMEVDEQREAVSNGWTSYAIGLVEAIKEAYKKSKGITITPVMDIHLAVALVRGDTMYKGEDIGFAYAYSFEGDLPKGSIRYPDFKGLLKHKGILARLTKELGAASTGEVVARIEEYGKGFFMQMTKVHEHVHLGAVRFMIENPEDSKTKYVNNLFKQMLKKAENDSSLDGIQDGYWKNNVDEFLAVALSNPDMMTYLSKMKAEGSRSTLHKLVGKLAAMVGIKLDSEAAMLMDSLLWMAENSVEVGVTPSKGNQIDETTSGKSSVNVYAGTGENAELSNFANRPFMYDGLKFNSVEQGFHYYKAMIAYREDIANKILATSDPVRVKQLTSNRSMNISKENLDKWDDAALGIMEDLMYESFKQNKKAIDALLATGGKVITHTQDRSRWKEDFPKALMTIRDKLKDEVAIETKRARWDTEEEAKSKEIELAAKNSSVQSVDSLVEIVNSMDLSKQAKVCTGAACELVAGAIKDELTKFGVKVDIVDDEARQNLLGGGNKNGDHTYAVVSLPDGKYIVDVIQSKYMLYDTVNGSIKLKEGYSTEELSPVVFKYDDRFAVYGTYPRIKRLKDENMRDFTLRRKALQGKLEKEAEVKWLQDDVSNYVIGNKTKDVERIKVYYNNVWYEYDTVEDKLYNSSEPTKEKWINKENKQRAIIVKRAMDSVKKEEPVTRGESKDSYVLFKGEDGTTYYTNDGQTNAINKLVEWDRSSESTFLLTGRGGTGKTTIVNKALEELGYGPDQVMFATPSHKAKEVIKEANDGSEYRDSEYVTLAAFVGMKPNPKHDEKNPDPREPAFIRDDFGSSVGMPRVLVIDEVSMLGGQLLKLVKERLYREGKNTKVIMMGDDVQLPPVGAGVVKSTVFTELEGKEGQHANLSERMRQKSESPILPFTDTLAAAVPEAEKATEEGRKYSLHDSLDISRYESTFDAVSNEGLVFTGDDYYTVLDHFVRDYKKDPDGTRFVHYNNEVNKNTLQRVAYIRNKLYGKEAANNMYMDGEKVVLNKPVVPIGEKEALNSGTELTVVGSRVVKEVVKYKHGKSTMYTDPVEFIIATVKDKDGKVYEIRTTDNDNYTRIGFAEKSKQGHRYFPGGLGQELTTGLNYNYVIGVHKAQGSSYNSVYMDVGNMLMHGSYKGKSESAEKYSVDSNSIAKGMYVAASRARKKLVVVDNRVNTKIGNPVSMSQLGNESVTDNNSVKVIGSNC